MKNADDVLFDMFKNETSDLLPIGKFLAVSCGLWKLRYETICDFDDI